MLRKFTVVAVAAFALAVAGCGGAPQLRIYKGTSTTTITSMGGSNTITTTNQAFSVIPGDQPNEWIFLNGDNVYVATASDMSLTFQGGQGYQQTETYMNQSYSISLSSGTGSLSSTTLSLNISGTVNSNGNMATYNLQYTGQRE